MNRSRARTARGGFIFSYCALIRPHLDIAYSYDPQIWQGHGWTEVGSVDATDTTGPRALVLSGSPMEPGLVQLGERMASGAPSSTSSITGSWWRSCSQALHSSAWQELERQRHKLKHEAWAGDKEKPFLQEDILTTEQPVQKHYTICILEGFQDPIGQSPVQPGLN